MHAGQEPDELTGAVAPPIYQTSTYRQDGVGRPRRGYEYARSQNPTRDRLERAVARSRAAHGIAFASGSATTAAIAELADRATRSSSATTCTAGRSATSSGSGGMPAWTASYVDLGSRPRRALGGAHRADRGSVWFETPTNPLLKVIDIAAAAATVARASGRGRARGR